MKTRAIKSARAIQKRNEIIDKARKVMREWRRWHKIDSPAMTKQLIDAVHDLDALFPGRKADEYQ